MPELRFGDKMFSMSERTNIKTDERTISVVNEKSLLVLGLEKSSDQNVKLLFFYKSYGSNF